MGRILAVGGAAALTLVVLAGCGRGGDDADASASTETSARATSSTTIKVESLAVGTCIGDPDQPDSVTTTRPVPCDQPHGQEVFEVFELSGRNYPGDGEVRQQAQTGCQEAFEAYVGTAFTSTSLEIEVLTPNEESWTTVGDREVICLVFDPNGPLTGSVEGSGR